MSDISIRFDTLCLGHMPELSTPFLPISLTKAIENTYLVRVSLCVSLTGKCLGKVYFFINNHMPLLGYRISIILIQYPTICFDLIDKVKMLIFNRFINLSTIDYIPTYN